MLISSIEMYTNYPTSSLIFSQISVFLLLKITFNDPIYLPNYTFIESKSSPFSHPNSIIKIFTRSI